VWKEEAEERPVLLTHFIKLYPSNAPASADPSTYMTTTVPVVSERYDEVVFTNPKVVFHKQLLDGQQQQQTNTKTKKRKKNKQLTYPLSHESSVIEHFRTYGDEMDVKAMLAAREFLQKELRTVKDRLIKVDDELEEVKDKLVAVASESSSTAAATISATAAKSTSKVASGSGGTKGGTSSAATSGKSGSTSISKSSKKKKTAAAGSASGEPASKKAKSS